jgi:hypothetical protein
MPTMMVRFYDSATTAEAAAKRLRDEGFEHVSHFKAAGGKGAANRAELVDGMMRAHVWKSHAEAYADRLNKGGALVTVHAPFGTAMTAGQILDAHNPVDEGIAIARHDDYVWDDAAPLSSLLHMPVLTRTRLPAETYMGISSLTKSSGFLSHWLNIPLLSAGSARKTSSFGVPLLSRSATPLSSAFGMKTLSQNPTPLSSLFGLKVLKRG